MAHDGALRAEPMGRHHFAAIREMHSCEPMMRYIGGVRSPEESLAYLERHLAHWAGHGFGFWMLFAGTGHRAIGLAGLRRLDLGGTSEIEFGYGFLPEVWGRGFATETARACLAYGRRHLQADSMVALTDPANEISQRVLTRAGLHRETSLLRDGVASELYRAPPSVMHRFATVPSFFLEVS